MKKFTFGMMILLGGIISLQSCSKDNDKAMSLNSQEFVTLAANGNMLEIQAGQQATQKGQSTAVRDYGQHMVTDHTTATQELNATATAEGDVTVPTQLDATHQQQLAVLTPLSGAAFDKAFATLMVQSHQEQVALFEKAVSLSASTEIRTFAGNKLPTLKEHLSEANQLNATVNQ